MIEASRGKSRVFITPVVAQAHRVLHIVLAEPGGASRGVPIELVPAPAGLAWRKVVFGVRAPAPPEKHPVSLELQAPRSRVREPSPESEMGILRTLRLMHGAGDDGAAAIAAANPAFRLHVLDGVPRSFGDFTLSNLFALRDATTGTLGLCVSVASASPRRLLFDPEAWVVRVGERIYPIRTLDFAGTLEPDPRRRLSSSSQGRRTAKRTGFSRTMILR